MPLFFLVPGQCLLLVFSSLSYTPVHTHTLLRTHTYIHAHPLSSPRSLLGCSSAWLGWGGDGVSHC